jgi:23S rRNA pseudouridine1911/1915/1917 synthase
MSLVAVRLISGRKHQIRLQFSHRGHPVLGDRKYGASTVFDAGIALHSWRLRITHPTKRESMWFQAEPPATWKPPLARLNIRRLDALRAEIERDLQLSTDDET